MESPRNSSEKAIRPVVWICLAGLLILAVAVVAVSRRKSKGAEEAGGAPSHAIGQTETQGQGVDESVQVKGTFETYRTALLQADYEAAWSIVDFHTKNFYSRAVQDGLSLARPNLNRLNPMNKFMVLRTRVEFRKPEIQKLTGRALFEAAVTNGWISRSTLERAPALHRVTVQDQYAAGYMEEAPQVPAFFFIKEAEGWKLSLWKSFDLVNAQLRADMQKAQKESGLSDDEFLLETLRRISKYEVDPRILDGPID